MYTQAVGDLIEQLQRLPGIGPRSAERLAYHLASAPEGEAVTLSEAISRVTRSVRPCSECANITESDPCPICSDMGRDRSLLCVVERPRDVHALESSGYSGLYHVLAGTLAPLDGIDARDLTIEQLVGKVRQGRIREVILATNPTYEGEQTALYLAELVSSCGVRVSRLARGLPVGSQLEFASVASLQDAMDGRRELAGVKDRLGDQGRQKGKEPRS